MNTNIVSRQLHCHALFCEACTPILILKVVEKKCLKFILLMLNKADIQNIIWICMIKVKKDIKVKLMSILDLVHKRIL